jgi:hypothetical protein
MSSSPKADNRTPAALGPFLSFGELAITLRMSAVAVCRSSARSSSVVRHSSCACKSATEGAWRRVTDDAIPRLVLADLRPFRALVLRALALVALLPVFSTRAISVPGFRASEASTSRYHRPHE